MIRDIREQWIDTFGSLSWNAFIYAEAGIILDTFWELVLERVAQKMSWSLLSKSSSRLVSAALRVICSIYTNNTSKIENWESIWVIILLWRILVDVLWGKLHLNESLRLKFWQIYQIYGAREVTFHSFYYCVLSKYYYVLSNHYCDISN